MTQPNRHADAWMVVLGALLISCKGILVKFLYADGVTVDAALFLRSVLALPMIWAWGWLRVGPGALFGCPPMMIVGAVVAGLAAYYLGAWLDFAALMLIDASLERILLFTYPVIVVVARALMLRRWPTQRMLLAVALAYVGIFFAVGGINAHMWQANGVGALLVIGSACCFTYFLIANERAAAVIGSVPFIVFAMTASAVAFSAHFVVVGDVSDLGLGLRAWIMLVAMTAVTNVLPLFMFSASINNIGAQRAAIISSVGPPMTIVMAWYWLGESMLPSQIVGAALIVVGVVVLETGRARSPI